MLVCPVIRLVLCFPHPDPPEAVRNDLCTACRRARVRGGLGGTWSTGGRAIPTSVPGWRSVYEPLDPKKGAYVVSRSTEKKNAFES